MKVREAEAGATRLRSAQERAASRLKKPKDKQQRASRKCFSENTRPTTTNNPRLACNSWRSPMRFMALERRTSPALEARTIAAIAPQVSSDLMLLLPPSPWRFYRLRCGQSRPTGDPAHAAADQQNPQ